MSTSSGVSSALASALPRRAASRAAAVTASKRAVAILESTSRKCHGRLQGVSSALASALEACRVVRNVCLYQPNSFGFLVPKPRSGCYAAQHGLLDGADGALRKVGVAPGHLLDVPEIHQLLELPLDSEPSSEYTLAGTPRQSSQILQPAERFSDVTGQCHRSVFGAKSAENGELRKVRFFLCPVKSAAWASKFARFSAENLL